MNLPASLAWTPDRATRPELLAMHGGSLVSRGPQYSALRFRDVAHAASWADSTDMTARVTFAQPVTDLTSVVTVLFDHRI